VTRPAVELRTAAAIAIITVLLGLALTGCGFAPDLRLPSGVVYPSITPDTGVSGVRTVSHTFRFEGKDRTVTVDIDEPVYRGAKAATKSVIRLRGTRADDWIESYYPAFIWEEHQDEFFAALLASLRQVRDAEQLDSDRYAELLTVFAQSLPYYTDPVDLEPKFPIETFAEKAGDCDDKALLLAGLLAREGYDVAIMLFEAEQHVSLGLRVDSSGYRGTGYAFVETTSLGFVGMVPEALDGGIELRSAPHVFPVNGGGTGYGAEDQVDAILEALEAASERIDALSPQIERADADIRALESRVSAEAARLGQLRSPGRTDEYNAAVPGYNALVAEFNQRATERNALADEYNRWVDLQRFVADNLDDRPGVYRQVIANLR